MLATVASACGREDDLTPALDTRPPAALAERFYPPNGWAWGLLSTTDAPAHRYGVGASRGASRGDIVILPGFGEPAEVWFETARALTAAGWTVWVLDLAGQGGSGRLGSPRDMTHVRDMAVNATAIRALVRHVVRPSPDRRVIVLAHGLGATAAVMALSEGLPEVDVAVLSAPDVSGEADLTDDTAVWARRLGLGARFAWGEGGWRSDAVEQASTSNDSARVAVRTEWMRANPPLRLGGVSWAWRAAHAQQLARLRESARLQRVGTPVTMLAPTGGTSAGLCQALPRCTLIPATAGGAPHLAVDAMRERWLTAVLVTAAGGAPLSPAPPAR